ncbi:hypothetical protein [Glycomyces tenuis]|uniref:hypothetical protein n=1 Tax=Glycomyces tenuis TaxID=58116 RepID=UPI00047DC653|nr:hypothetical protein [Glycomyces tenuis]
MTFLRLTQLVHLTQQMIQRGFHTRDFLIAGSARVLVEGWIDEINDIDIVARGQTLEAAFELAFREGHNGLAVGKITGDKTAQLYGGRVEVSQRWVGIDKEPDRLIDDADVIGGLRFLSLADVAAYKRRLNRPKDRHILEELRRRGY